MFLRYPLMKRINMVFQYLYNYILFYGMSRCGVHSVTINKIFVNDLNNFVLNQCYVCKFIIKA